jgi:hypothetical protein
VVPERGKLARSTGDKSSSLARQGTHLAGAPHSVPAKLLAQPPWAIELGKIIKILTLQRELFDESEAEEGAAPPRE